MLKFCCLHATYIVYAQILGTTLGTHLINIFYQMGVSFMYDSWVEIYQLEWYRFKIERNSHSKIYTAKIAFNNVLLPALFNVVNNIVQYCYT